MLYMRGLGMVVCFCWPSLPDLADTSHDQHQGTLKTSHNQDVTCIATCCFQLLGTGPVPFASLRHIHPLTWIAMALRPESVQDWCALAEGQVPLDDILTSSWHEVNLRTQEIEFPLFVNLMLMIVVNVHVVHFVDTWRLWDGKVCCVLYVRPVHAQLVGGPQSGIFCREPLRQ